MHTSLPRLGLLAAVLLIDASQANAGQSYTFTDLGTLGGKYSYATGINNASDISGAYTFGYQQHAAVWIGTTGTTLGTLGGTTREAFAINNAGVAAGYSSTTGDAAEQAAVWKGSQASSLDTLGGSSSHALAINNAGDTAGYAFTNSNIKHATVWNGTTVTDLDPLGTDSSAFGINNAGEVAGYVRSASGNEHATVWNGTTATDLGTLGGAWSRAAAINTAGDVVGSAATTSGAQRATLWHNNTAIDLGNGSATAINNSGQVLGVSGGIAMLWTIMGSVVTATDINSFLSASDLSAGWVLGSPYGINDMGSIVGQAQNSRTGAYDAFLLSASPLASAVPEPDTCAMLLTGLGLMGFMVRRRKTS